MYNAGIHGVFFFTTSLTSLALANWIKRINLIADDRKEKIQSLQRLNEHTL